MYSRLVRHSKEDIRGSQHHDLAHSMMRLLRHDKLACRIGACPMSWAHGQFGAERLVADAERVQEASALDRGRRPDPWGMDSTWHLQGVCEVK